MKKLLYIPILVMIAYVYSIYFYQPEKVIALFKTKETQSRSIASEKK